MSPPSTTVHCTFIRDLRVGKRWQKGGKNGKRRQKMAENVKNGIKVAKRKQNLADHWQ